MGFGLWNGGLEPMTLSEEALCLMDRNDYVFFHCRKAKN